MKKKISSSCLLTNCICQNYIICRSKKNFLKFVAFSYLMVLTTEGVLEKTSLCYNLQYKLNRAILLERSQGELSRYIWFYGSKPVRFGIK